MNAIEEVLTLWNMGVLTTASISGTFMVRPAMTRLEQAMTQERIAFYNAKSKKERE